MEECRGIEGYIPIPEFYAGKTLLVTGFTGYLGKLLVEKLLYDCPDIETIYVIIRRKKGVEPMDRCRETFKSMAFERLRKRYPTALETKVVPICGDTSDEGLGVSEADRRLLADRVHLIFHGAASVRFDDPLYQAIHQNVRGTKAMLDFALDMNKLQCLVYISTAYSNCDSLDIRERLHPPKQDWNVALKIADNVDPTVLDILSLKVLDKLPNTYTYTKSLAEHVVNDYRHKLPVVIARPSLVISGLKEPIEGWMDSFNSPMRFMVANMLGISKCALANDDCSINYIYSDFVINATIVIAWKSVTRKEALSVDEVTVYNVCADPNIRMSFKNIINSLDGARPDEITPTEYSYKSLHLYESLFWYKVSALYRHVLPALFIDLLLRLNNKTPMLLKVRRKLLIGDVAIRHFTSNSFRFETERYQALAHDLRGEDRIIFGSYNSLDKFRQNTINTFVLSRRTIMKPIYDNEMKNFKYIAMLYYIDQSSVVLTYSALAWLLYTFQIPQFMISGAASLMMLS